jgi:hypothetical protein
MRSLTSQGHPRADYQRAIERGNLLQAKAFAKIITANVGGKLSLGDALSLLFLIAAKQDERYERAALVWHARFEREVPTLTIEESLLALSTLAALGRIEKDDTAQQGLAALCRAARDQAGVRAYGVSRRPTGTLRSPLHQRSRATSSALATL